MANKQEKLTPAMKQFHHFKEKYPDAVLFFRMGDFYETFYEDARTCSRVLGLALTSRSKGTNPIPLAGVPYHAVDTYLKKMLQAGYKVAVCEQVEDPKLARGVVKRDVVRIVTPGTLTDEMLLDAGEDNFLCAVSIGAKSSGISWVDISTGHFFAQELAEDDVLDEILRLAPKECLLPDMRGELFEAQVNKLSKDISQITGAVVTNRPSWYFDPFSARKRLRKHFGTKTLAGFGIDDGFAGISAAGAVIEYLNETQKVALAHISTIKKVERTNFLQIDAASLRSLEIFRSIRAESSKGTLLDCLDVTLTGMGSRMIRNWIFRPLCDIDAVELRHDTVQEFSQKDRCCTSVRGLLKKTSDVERIAARVSTLRTTPKDLVALRITLSMIPDLRTKLGECESDIAVGLKKKCDSMDELAELLERAIVDQPPSHIRDGGVIRAGFDAGLDRLRSISKDGRSWLAEFQQRESKRTGIANLKVGFNKVFGYYIEISHAAAQDKVPADYVRKQTIKNAERYITEGLKTYEEEILTAREKALGLEQRLFEKVRTETTKYLTRLQALAEVLANIDCLTGLAFLARLRNYVRPEMTFEKELVIEEGKHPVLAETMGAEFVPNDVAVGAGQEGDLIIITGPNMAGKSTYIRQVALLVLMAQAGSFIPAKKARIGIVDKIFTRVGASDELVRGQSTFMVEMTETANIINNATENSLVILDEVGRGTSTYDGLALAWAITEHIANNIKCRTLFATHYHELTELAELLVNVKNCNVAVREWQGEVVFLHKILPGGTDKSYGIHVAKLAGIGREIVSRSSEILADLEATFTKEACGTHLGRHKTKEPDADSLFVQKHKSVLEKLADLDVNNLTPIEAINLLEAIKKEIKTGDCNP
ncbi:MAG TPA: DNA mismatch repair protein MutS [Planctomycetes bacterium]|nr:DNA mismatch repair protein MutS [Planctomycetota bacterium]